VVELADTLREFFVLLDVPPGLNQRQMLRWRQRFGSSYAAAYHPWLKIVRSDDRRDALIRLNPSAVAAGIIAQRELLLGVPHGPANVIANGVVDVESRVGPEQHAELHQSGVNVYLRERDGVRLSAARTLSRDPRYRQLSVSRLMTLLRRTLESEMQWAVFEPNDASLRLELQRSLSAYLRRLYRANAFTGATENEAFFVRCDDELNPIQLTDQGRLLAHVGVAPAEPLEFLVLKVARASDGTLTVEG
jgi:phage tail sheath protein FI